MRAKRVVVNVRVKVIVGTLAGKYGIIDAISEGKNGQLISVRCEGATHGHLYKANELLLIQEPAKQVIK